MGVLTEELLWASVNIIPADAIESNVGVGICECGLNALISPYPMSSANI